MMNIPLEGRDSVDVCLDILRGRYAILIDTPESDDRELQMAACFFLVKQNIDQNTKEKVVFGLIEKLSDDRAVREYNTGNEGYWGSDYFISACAVEALVSLGYAPSIDEVYERAVKEGLLSKMPLSRENNREGYWHPKEIVIEGDVLMLREM